MHLCDALSLFPKRQVLDSSKLEEFADDNYEFDDVAESSPTDKTHCGKRRNCSLREISPFPALFSKDLYCRQVKTGICLQKGYTNLVITHILKGTIESVLSII